MFFEIGTNIEERILRAHHIRWEIPGCVPEGQKIEIRPIKSKQVNDTA